MRRAGVIVALTALLGLFGAVVTASPALARGPKWTFLNFGKHFTEPAVICGFTIKGTQLVEQSVHQESSLPEGLHVIAYRATLDVPRELAWFVAKLLLAERQRRGRRAAAGR